MEPHKPRREPLEDRLRSLILTNADTGPAQRTRPGDAMNPTERAPSGSLPPTGRPAPGGVQTSPNAARLPKGGKKRPNQAQRRQMNTELTIPIDVGPLYPPSPKQRVQPQHHREPQSFQNAAPQNTFPSHAPAQAGNIQPYPASNSGHPYGQPQRGYSQPSTRGGRQSFQSKTALSSAGSHRQAAFNPEQLGNQSRFLDHLCYQVIADTEIQLTEISEKESFRRHVEVICREVVTRYEEEVNCAREFRPETVELKCFGSLASGFATKGSDMDLGLLSPMSRLLPSSPESPIPRLIEEALLKAGFGARLLTKARVPIIKLCQKPDVNLQKKLLDARKKWERGLEQDEREPEEDAPDDSDLLQGSNLPIETDSPQTSSSKHQMPPHPSAGSKANPTPEEELLSLKQSNNQSLTGYYGNAKRVLRRLNGRDITHSNSQDFTKADYILLDKVADAYVKGLYDSELRNRILAYPSFHTGGITQLTNYRSLSGVHAIIEGETLVLSWDKQKASRSNAKMDQVYSELVRQWHDLQFGKNFGTNPIWFNKEVQRAIEPLRQFSPLQITQLQQDQFEPPVQYHERTVKIAVTLSEVSSVPNADIGAQVVDHYVNGIRPVDIKNMLREFVTTTGTRSLSTIARTHRSLHLAADYERAIAEGLYHSDDVPVIQKYISILRRKPALSNHRPNEYYIPIMQSEAGVLDRMRQLPDPATLSPNKPKDRYSDSLEFPKYGVGVQCDINFSAHLALQNTLLLRCYSYTDARVKPLILFVKHWAKTRGINTPYRGTLSSYGYVLMVLHYLVNIAEPFVCPNLQVLAPLVPDLPPEALEGFVTCQGYNVHFWRDERAIQSLAQQGQLNQNRESVGSLLRGFFEYYAQGNMMMSKPRRSFDWGRDVLSLRTHGGLLSKSEKGWTGAKTVLHVQNKAPPLTELAVSTPHPVSPPSRRTDESLSLDEVTQSSDQQTTKAKEVKEVRHRFLFAIEDPFELDHNVARTVTHNGIVSIRNELRRAWDIIKSAGNGYVMDNLLEDVKAQKEQAERQQFISLFDEVHGKQFYEDSRGL